MLSWADNFVYPLWVALIHPVQALLLSELADTGFAKECSSSNNRATTIHDEGHRNLFEISRWIYKTVPDEHGWICIQEAELREKKAEIFRNGLSVAVVHCQHALVFVTMRTHYPEKIAPPVVKVELTDEQLLVHLRTCAHKSKGSILAYDRFPERLRDITTQKYILMSKTLHACAFSNPNPSIRLGAKTLVSESYCWRNALKS